MGGWAFLSPYVCVWERATGTEREREGERENVYAWGYLLWVHVWASVFEMLQAFSQICFHSNPDLCLFFYLFCIPYLSLSFTFIWICLVHCIIVNLHYCSSNWIFRGSQEIILQMPLLLYRYLCILRCGGIFFLNYHNFYSTLVGISVSTQACCWMLSNQYPNMYLALWTHNTRF